MPYIGKLFITVSALTMGIGLLLSLAPNIPFLGKLPGDIRIERPGFSFYFPLTTSILLSLLLTFILNLFL